MYSATPVMHRLQYPELRGPTIEVESYLQERIQLPLANIATVAPRPKYLDGIDASIVWFKMLDLHGNSHAVAFGPHVEFLYRLQARIDQLIQEQHANTP